MKISVFGLGYVGAVTAACLAREGHTVVGVDVSQTKVDLINAGSAPIIEAEIGEVTKTAVESGRLVATTESAAAIRDTELSLVCVGTPSEPNGSLSLTFVRKVCEEIGAGLRQKEGFHVVVVRSTVLPGTLMGVVKPGLEKASGKKAGVDFGLCDNPEFLREGTSVYDFYHPPKTVIGSMDERSADLLASLYADLNAPLIRTSVEVAEMVKYVDNNFHALKVTFANEIGRICKAVGVDSHEVMDIFCQDTKLNLSRYYFKPGFAFGGSCLPKDVRALTYKARSLDVDVPMLNSLLASNEAQIKEALRRVIQSGKRAVGILGMSFKAGTDDLRESPVVELIETLIGKGYELKIFDENVSIARLTGANREYIVNHIPHISSLLVEDIDAVIEHSELLIISHAAPAFEEAIKRLRSGQLVVDLVRLANAAETPAHYDGLCW